VTCASSSRVRLDWGEVSQPRSPGAQPQPRCVPCAQCTRHLPLYRCMHGRRRRRSRHSSRASFLPVASKRRISASSINHGASWRSHKSKIPPPFPPSRLHAYKSAKPLLAPSASDPTASDHDGAINRGSRRTKRALSATSVADLPNQRE
jgi:hypothetical protein